MPVLDRHSCRFVEVATVTNPHGQTRHFESNCSRILSWQLPLSVARFKVGETVRARNIHPTGRTRLPRYVRGKLATIHRDHGVHVFPDTNADFLGENSYERLQALPRLPRDEGEPVLAEPWQAQAFALAVKLSEQGHFTWKEWADALADELKWRRQLR